MSNEKTVGIVVGVVVGVVAAQIGNATIKRIRDEIHQEEITNAEIKAYQLGWHAASHSPVNIRNRFIEMFGKPNEKEGTTAKA